MHKSLNKFALAGAAGALAVIPAIAAAQESSMPAEAAAAEAPKAEAPAEDPRLANLPADKQAALKAWPADTQEYYWSLSEERQKMFWALSDSDKVALSQMAEPQRESVWAQIEARARSSQSG